MAYNPPPTPLPLKKEILKIHSNVGHNVLFLHFSEDISFWRAACFKNGVLNLKKKLMLHEEIKLEYPQWRASSLYLSLNDRKRKIGTELSCDPGMQ